MSLLLDANLSWRLARPLSDLLGNSVVHVSACSLGGATDQEIWRYARREAATILTLDRDFLDLSTLYGAPPRVLYVSGLNVKRDQRLLWFEARSKVIRRFLASDLPALELI